MKNNWQHQWVEAIVPDEPHKFSRRLLWDCYSQEDFLQYLQSPGQSRNTTGLNWESCLLECRRALKKSWDQSLLPVGSDEEQLAFVDLWWPIRCHAKLVLTNRLKSRPGSEYFLLQVFDQLADSLLTRLCSLGEQVLWEEFNSERTPGTMLLAHLGSSGDGSGPPVRDHYERFIHRHRKDGLEHLLEEFPELGRFVGTVVILWLQSSTEMLERICDDRDVLERLFSIPMTHSLLAVQQGLSDPHRGGRAVAVLSFGSEMKAEQKVVYKPKDMGVDSAYQSLLTDLNRHSILAPLRTLTIHNADGYGYMEYVPHLLVKDDIEMERFYVNAGRLTAVLHLLGCTDCHHENLIACGDQILLIDTETLLEADVPDHVSETKENQQEAQQSTLAKRFQSSVLRSGLMPQWMFLGGAKTAVDISALGMSPAKEATYLAHGWLGLNSDGMMPGRVSKTSEIPTSLPVGVGSDNPFKRFITPFCTGFQDQSDSLIKMRHSWLASDGPLELFAGLRRRIVLRATRVYFTIQRQQLEPAALRSPLVQSLKIEQLARSFLLSESKPLHWPVFCAEREQMQQLDIPFFTHVIDGDSLDLNQSGETLSDFIKTSGLSAARDRLLNLNQEEISFQLRLIRGACTAKQMRRSSEEILTDVTSTDGFIVDQQNSEIESISKVVDKINDLAIHDANGQVEWLGMDLGGDGESFSFGPVGLSLYGGSIGIACLMERMHSSINTGNLRVSILKPLSQLLEQANDDERLRWWRDQPLGLSGCGGILLALHELSLPNWVDELLLSARSRFIDSDQQLDLIGGSAGLIAPLLTCSSDHALAVATEAGDHLLATQTERGCWDQPRSRNPGLLGFSHGTAGNAAALAQLHRATGESRFLNGAQAALLYERAHYNQSKGNWPDFRESDQDLNYMVSWCHGAPGIGLARSCLWGTSLWDDTCLEEISIATATTTTFASSGQATDHLCCGSLGLMLTLEALTMGPWRLDASVVDDARLAANRIRSDALKRSTGKDLELRCFGTRESTLLLPGFFTGLSGMAMALMQDPASKKTTLNLLTGGLWSLSR
ncbi:type 2 lanthipeptide synthetase LanM family protein [Synechococcus sp. UW105]|uniref:type 2 lanthipeptide synthetase LanM family protein n=1 Tax=Synechococcus sp. UW105 TaxID=337067 RepID=UPI000E0F0795|nr:type 2 lanthipeptide synthetase LanM family protein [Synechococcus sp. UW105]